MELIFWFLIGFALAGPKREREPREFRFPGLFRLLGNMSLVWPALALTLLFAWWSF